MIFTLRKKFILINAVSILLVFTGIFLFQAVSGVMQMNRILDTLTDAIASNDGVFPAFQPSGRSPLSDWLAYEDVITEETRFSTRFFTVRLDENGQVTEMNMNAVSAISEEEVADFAARAAAEGDERGWVSDYRYKAVPGETGTMFVFVNGNMQQNLTFRQLFTAFLVLLGSALLILMLTVVISKRAVRPVAESYEKQKQFITDANHELKTPLTLILSNLDIVESEVGKNEWLEDIRSEGERMKLLIDQMVTLSRMDESDAPEAVSDFDLSGAVLDTVSEFAPLAAERGKALSADIAPDLPYHGDEALVRRLTAILLDNAVKYCDPGGVIRVQLYHRHHPVLIVENTCADVDQLELDRLFDRFYRADKARTFSGSFGVGLSIAQSIVKNHHRGIHAYRKGQMIGFRVDLK